MTTEESLFFTTLVAGIICLLGQMWGGVFVCAAICIGAWNKNERLKIREKEEELKKGGN